MAVECESGGGVRVEVEFECELELVKADVGGDDCGCGGCVCMRKCVR